MLHNSNNRKVVVFFTDGEPNHSNGFSGSVAAEAVNTAYSMKQDETLIYAIGMMDGANPADTSANFNKYMNGVSSNYPSAYARNGSWNNMNLGWRVDESSQYYFAASSASELSGVFANISDSISSLTANPDEQAVLSDNLTKYFTFGDSVSSSGDGVIVQYVPVTGKVGDKYTWGEPQEVSVRVTVENGRIAVTGFDYKDNAVTENNGQYSGGKLVVSFPIEVSDAEITENDYYNTNETSQGVRAGLVYKANEGSHSNNAQTLLTQSPQVWLEVADADGTPVTVQVFLDGVPVKEPYEYITLDRSVGENDRFNEFDADTVDENGIITCEFNYNADNGHDCVDVNVGLKSGVSGVIIQGFKYFQSCGSSGGKAVDENNGVYTIDNVVARSESDERVDLEIHLSSTYQVKYYVDNVDNGSAEGVFIAAESVTGENTTPTANGAESTDQSWKETGYSKTANLKQLPVNTDTLRYSGWYVGSPNNGTAVTSVDITAANDIAEEKEADHVIEVYAVSSANSFTVTYEWTGEVPTSETKPGDATVVYGGSHTVDTDYTSSTVVNETNDDGEVTATYTFSGWQYNNSAAPETIDNITGNITITGTWTKVENAAYSVTYQVNGDAPATFTPAVPGVSSHYTGTSLTVAGDLTTTETTKTDVEGNVLKGTWKFNGWETTDTEVTGNTFTMPGMNVAFTGTWTFTEAMKYGVTYVYESGTNDMMLPEAISTATGDYAISDTNDYYAGDTVERIKTQDGKTYNVYDTYGNVTGIWMLTSWDYDEATMTSEGFTFTGTWTFAEQEVETHSVLYTWQGDPRLPGDDVVTLPSGQHGLVKGQPYTVDSTYTSQSKIEEKDQYGNVTGIWTFSGWKLDGKVVTGEQIMGDETVYLRGVWTLTEQDVPKHTVSYDWGENAPASETLPAGITGLVKGESYTIDSTYTSATVVEVTDDSGVVIGTYTFSGWTDPNGNLQ